MDSAEQHVCPVCGQPVASVVRKYKTLGAWVPRWGPGPCRNPACASGPEPTAPAPDTPEPAPPDRPAAPREPPHA
ncbi:hypothetical protein [Streptomyces tropicalis]|uniref:Uncharacterized protein n=1 Tax=Streptomyces tropicalis TaxID=3034234 RepID=A0ABT5ZZX5_9ACTN|nr:hypothetical protein [Streptomyces tropicalis]MDF3297942.1 hypothetical protein [Streptomyces tropicalis]